MEHHVVSLLGPGQAFSKTYNMVACNGALFTFGGQSIAAGGGGGEPCCATLLLMTCTASSCGWWDGPCALDYAWREVIATTLAAPLPFVRPLQEEQVQVQGPQPQPLTQPSCS